MSIFNILCCLALMAAGRNQAAFCMDMDTQQKASGMTEGLSLPGLAHELKGHILALCNRNMDQEERIVELIKLRKVCTTWRTILTDKFIANAVGLPDVSWELEECLALAAKNKQVDTLSLICRVYPWVSKQKALNGIFNELDRYFDMLKILLNFGLNPSSKSRVYDGRSCSIDSLLSIVLNDFTPQAREIFDLLLDLEAVTTELGLLELAALENNLYAIDKLLALPLHPFTDFGGVCGDLLARRCCIYHHQHEYQLFRTIVHQLIRHGADRALFDNQLERCERAILHDLHISFEKNCNDLKALRNMIIAKSHRSNQYDQFLTKFWKLIDDGDAINMHISQRTGRPLYLWSSHSIARLPQPGIQSSRMKKEPLFYWGVIGLAVCYGIYHYCYSDTISEDEDQPEDSEGADETDIVQSQESDL